MNSSRPIRVTCVDDHACLVAGLRALITSESDMSFVGAFSTLEGILDRIQNEPTDVLMLDIEVPGPDVFEITREIARRFPTTRVIVLSAHVRDHYIDSAMQAGAYGYLSKSEDAGRLVDAIRRVARGERVFGSEVAGRVQTTRNTTAETPHHASRIHLLTPRENQILRMIGKGQSRTEIARAIHRSPKTVDAHRASIMEKLGIHDRVELARYAIREGLVEV